MVGNLLCDHAKEADTLDALRYKKQYEQRSLSTQLLLQCDENQETTRLEVAERLSQIIAYRPVDEICLANYR